jgi:transcription elongation factor Elf1
MISQREVKCLNCGHEFIPETVLHDNLGEFCICPECGSSFDVFVDDDMDRRIPIPPEVMQQFTVHFGQGNQM